MINKLLIIPDSHAHPDYDNDRFTWLGRYILDEKPDVILNLGDMADMPSLSSYDKGTKGFEGRRFIKDVSSVVDANQKLWEPLISYNLRQSDNHKQRYKPRTIMLVGNHEDRIDRAVNQQAELEGAVSIQSLDYESFYDEIYGYGEKLDLEGFTCSHFLPSGIMGRPIGGENAAHTLISKMHTGCIVGHSHVLDMAVRTDGRGHKLMGIVAGCYVHPEMIEAWNKAQASLWWNGIITLGGVENGYAEEYSHITQKELRNRYSG